jgi:serine/threonine protein kinase
MSLGVGTHIGSHEITALLGCGGMGEVYRARDLKLKRDVAIKILPEEFSRDADRVSRFQREAQVLASLNHPNIAGIHDLAEANGLRYLVLELVEGETLEERLKRGPIPLDEALVIAQQIADALDAAHERGIVHRDLKPANIKLTPDSRVKVLDFGLAKPLQEQLETTISNSPTVMAASMPGVMLGTPAYMSPEQARGKTIDKRADIWSFACVLYEMLTGQMAFTGDTVPDILAASLSRDVDLEGLPKETPPRIRELLARCLQKDFRRRLRDAGDAKIEIDDAMKDLASPVSNTNAPARAATRSWISFILAGAVVALTMLVVWQDLKRPAAVPWLGNRLGGPSFAMEPRLSPDGRLIAFVASVDGTHQVGVINPGSGDWTILTHDQSRGYLSNITWAPDGSKIYYGRFDGVPRGVFSVPALGGSERLVLDDAQSPKAMRDGSLLVSRLNEKGERQLYRFWPETGRLDAYPALLEGSEWQTIPAFRDGREAIFWGRPTDQPDSDAKNSLYAMDLNSKKTRRITTNLKPYTDAALTITPDDASILTVTQSGDLTEVVAIPRNGGNARALFSTTNEVIGIDAAEDGSIYVDQLWWPFELLRLASPSAAAERILNLDSGIADVAIPPMSDGRIIVQTFVGGRSRLQIGKPRTDPIPFLQTSEETSAPLALIGTDELAFVVGSGASRKLAIASITDGRIIRRLEKVDGSRIGSLAASPDEQTLYYVADRRAWSVPAADGEPRMLRQADAIAIDPQGKYLIVELNEKNGLRLIRFPLGGEAETPLSFPGARLVFRITPNAVRSDGAILTPLAVGGFNWALGLLHPDTGKFERIAIDPSFDVHHPGFLPDGRILVAGYGLRSSLWRFTPQR